MIGENGHTGQGDQQNPEGWQRIILGQEELAGDKLRMEINRQARELRARVTAYLDENAGQTVREADRHIREALVRPAVEAFNRHAGREARPRLPAAAVAEIFSRLRGLGPLDRLMEDGAITEILVDGPGKPVYVEKRGQLLTTDVTLTREEILLSLERMQAGEGHPLSALNPVVEVRLPTARVTAVHERLVPLGGPSLTIRRRSTIPLTGEDIVRLGMLPAQVLAFLSLCLNTGSNLLIAGGTSSGKTTLAQVLLMQLPPENRLLTVEDPVELALQDRPRTQQLEVRHADLKGEGGVSTRALVRLCLRLRPDNMVIGKVLDGAALDMVDAMATGHRGSLSTLHAGDPRATFARLEQLCLRGDDAPPLPSVRATVAQAINLIVVTKRVRAATTRGGDGAGEWKRVVSAVSEVRGLEGDVPRLQDLLTWQEGARALQPTGLSISEELATQVEQAGLRLPSLAALGSGTVTRLMDGKERGR